MPVFSRRSCQASDKDIEQYHVHRTFNISPKGIMGNILIRIGPFSFISFWYCYDAPDSKLSNACFFNKLITLRQVKELM